MSSEDPKVDLDKEITNLTIFQSIERIAELFKVFSNTKRLQIVSLLLEEPQEFSTLLKKIRIKKTSLSNHLTQILSVDIIKRVERGRYEITNDGKALLTALEEFYSDSELNRKIQREETKKRYIAGRMKMEKETSISIDPIYEPCWISYLGAISGIMKAKGKDSDITDVGGYTGYVFALPNVSKGVTCPSGPTALAVWEDIIKKTQNLGFKVQTYMDDGSFPEKEGELSAKDIERAKKLFDYIQETINEGNSSVLWGIPVPEYGIVKGYSTGNEDTYLVSTFRHLSKRPDEPIRFDALQAPGCLHAITIQGEKTVIPDSVDKDTIDQAVRFAEGKKTYENYVAGPKAYEEWASVLENGKEEDILYHGNSYVGECTLEAKALSTEFLKRLATKYAQKSQKIPLNNAMEQYEAVKSLLEQFRNLFPFAFEGDTSKEKRLQGAELLRSVIPYEEKAIEFLKEALEVWE